MAISPKDVLKQDKPSNDFLVPALGYNYFQFLQFSVKNLTNDEIVFSIKSPDGMELDWSQSEELLQGNEIHYEFPISFLDSKLVETKLTFAVGPQELKSFRMIERHYFRSKLLKSYDFTFGFCIPNSENTWEQTYEVPPIKQTLKQEMIDNPGETRSDSYYFIDEKLVLHNKASYSYIP